MKKINDDCYYKPLNTPKRNKKELIICVWFYRGLSGTNLWIKEK